MLEKCVLKDLKYLSYCCKTLVKYSTLIIKLNYFLKPKWNFVHKNFNLIFLNFLEKYKFIKRNLRHLVANIVIAILVNIVSNKLLPVSLSYFYQALKSYMSYLVCY